MTCFFFVALIATYLIFSRVVKGFEKLGHRTMSSNVHSESRSHAFTSKSDGRKATCGVWIVLPQRIENLFDIVVEFLKFTALLYLMSFLYIFHDSVELKKRISYNFTFHGQKKPAKIILLLHLR